MSAGTEAPEITGHLPKVKSRQKAAEEYIQAGMEERATILDRPPPGWKPPLPTRPPDVLHAGIISEYLATIEPVYNGICTARLTDDPIEISKQTFDVLQHEFRQKLIDLAMREINRRGQDLDKFQGMKIVL